MTIEQADKIAEVVQNAPRMYDSIPSLEEGMKPFAFNSSRYSAYPWISLANHLGGLFLTDAPRNPNVYFSDQGFSAVYSSIIKDWQATEIRGYTGFGQRYVTIDDIRMIPYLGIEYARAKLEGWRYRFGYVQGLERESAYIPKGGIVRLENGLRFVHRTTGNITAPPGSGGPYSDQYYAYKFWTPVKRLPGYEVPTNGEMGLPADFEMPAEPTSTIVKIGTLVGADDIVRFNPYFQIGNTRGLNESDSIVKSGGFEIVLTTSDSLTEESLENSFVVCQIRVQNDYIVYEDIYDAKGKLTEKWHYFTMQQPPKGVTYSTRRLLESNCSMAPLKKDVTYNVFVKFDNATLVDLILNRNRFLVSYVRTGTRKVAPYMWSAGSNSPHQYTP